MYRKFRKSIFVFIVLIFVSSNSQAQVDYDFSGYLVDFPIYQHSNKRISDLLGLKNDQFLNLTRIRLKPTIYFWSGSRLNIEYEISSFYLNSKGNLFVMQPGKTKTQIVDLTWTPVLEDNIIVSHFIDRLYFRQGFEWGNIELGRQRISWGTGRIWNPTDLFNPINPASFYKIEKDGADVISGEVFLGNFTDINIVFNPQDKISASNYGFRFRTNMGEFDLSVIGGYFDDRIVAGGDFAGNLFDAGIRGEGIISAKNGNLNENFFRYILGLDYQFTPELYSLVEYQFNGEGRSNKSEYELLRLVKGDILNLSRNYVNITVIYQIHPLLNLSFSNNSNLNDGSGFITFQCNYSMYENFYLNLGLQSTYGSEFTEYWYYPFSIYLQSEFYF